MRILSLLILAVLLIAMQKIKSPHGQAFKAECAVCHSTKGWQLDREIYSFRHDTTRFPLAGQHSALNCRDCHRSLVFSEADHLCSGCHRDVHQGTLGQDCSRCHTPSSWLVNIYQIHDLSRFPLLGMHRITDCAECHRSENPVRFDIIGSECIDCHRQEYLSASPNHIQSGFSEDCNTCHNVYSLHWEGAGFNHNFFPLTSGHSSLACTDCHDGQNYQAASRECSSCHLEEYNSTTNPAHRTLNFPLACNECHTTDPGWKPAAYREHDSKSFPIYSGEHKGEWSSCTDCHTQPSNYSLFSCITCHEHNKADMDNEHRGETGYSWSPMVCLQCHRNGKADK
jgi:hypothetical protein